MPTEPEAIEEALYEKVNLKRQVVRWIVSLMICAADHPRSSKRFEPG